MMLLPDGSVLAASGGAEWARLTPNSSGSYINGTWTRLADANDSRLYDASQVLPDGRVFVAGAEYGTGGSTGETYDPLTNTWTKLPTQTFGAFSDAGSILLPNGTVLVAPVAPNPSGYTTIFDPSTNTWSQGPKLFRGGSADEQSFVKLADDSILTVDSNTTSERYIPSQNRWINDGAVPVALFDSLGELGAGLRLPDGRAFFVGGTGHTALYMPTGSTAKGTWVAGPDVPGKLGASDAPAAMLADGTVLLAVGPSGTYNGPTTFYTYDPIANTFTRVSSPTVSSPPYVDRFLDLPDGTVLFTSGSQTPEVYNPNVTALAIAKPTITSLTPNPDGTVSLSGTGLNGLNAGAAYGDDAQMDSNYPIVRLTGSDGTVYFARTSNWSSFSVATGSTPETTTFTLPVGAPPDTYSVVAIANGVASDPSTLTVSLTDNNAPPTVAVGAVAAPTPVTGTTTALSVLGADDNDESNLVYTWRTGSSPSGAPLPSFSINGSNAAKNTTVTFHRAGNYTFVVTITDAGGLFATGTTSVTVDQTKSSITVSPDRATITSSNSQNLTATALDQFSQKMLSQPVFTWSVLSGGGNVNSAGQYHAPVSGTLATVQATDGTFSATGQVGVVSAPWASQDIGGPDKTGIAYDTNGNANGTFHVEGGGGDIWGTSDQFRFVYHTLSGDGYITARVASEQNTDANAKAGVMIRGSLDDNAQYADMFVTPTSGAFFQYRTTIGGQANGTSSITGIAAPYWVRIVRVGNLITGYRSKDGNTWFKAGSITVAFGSTTYIGLELTAHNNSKLCTSTFDNVVAGRGALLPWLQTGSVATWDATAHTLTVTGDATIIADPAADAPQLIVGQGGVVHINSTAHIGGLNLTSGGAVLMTSVSNGTTPRAAGAQHVLIINSGASIVIDPYSKLDLADNDMIVQGGDLNTLLPLLTSGRGAKGGLQNGTWIGNGINSSAAAAKDAADGQETTALGIALVSDIQFGQIATSHSFDGQSVNNNDVLIKYTYNGDVNLDGVVNTQDATTIAGFFNDGATTDYWAMGDTNYDGVVDNTDVTSLAGLYLEGTAGGVDTNAL
jgi:hypothetical protein